MEKLLYKVQTFEGPLDLLLYLITKNKLNILDIQISELLAQYMEQIRAMEENEMDVASEFLEMAARLVYLKTLSLLPKHEEAETLKQELTGQLLEYQECKRIALMMTEHFCYNSFVRGPLELEPDYTYRREHNPREILTAYLNAAGKGKRFIPPTQASFSGIVTHKIVSVNSQIVYVLRKLWKVKEIGYQTLFEEKQERSELVATFLAVLELVKGKRVSVDGDYLTARVCLLPVSSSKFRRKLHRRFSEDESF